MLKVLMLKPGQLPESAEIGEELADLQAAVGGCIEIARSYPDGAVMLCNEEGKNDDLPPNRCLLGTDGHTVVDYIAGPALICGVKGEAFTSLARWQLEKYAAAYRDWIPEDAYAAQ